MEYGDARYLEWLREFQKLIDEYLGTEGNSVMSLEGELADAIENSEFDEDAFF